MRRVLKLLVPAAIVAAGIGLWVTAPDKVDAAQFAEATGDVEAGKVIFTAAGCASCHHTKGAEDKLLLTDRKSVV